MPDSPAAANAPSPAGAIRAAALLLAASNLLSRVLGYGRDWLINYEFGATGQTDIYQASFTLPDFINYLLAGGALSVSLLPRMAELFAKQRQGTAEISPDAAFSKVCSVMAVATLALVGLAMIGAEPIIRLWMTGFTDDQVIQTVHLTRIVLPAQVFFLIGGLFQAVLLAKQRVRALALTPLLYNGGIIAGGLLGGRLGQIEGFSWGALAGALAGGLLVPLWSARREVQVTLTFEPKHPEIRRFLITALPLMLGVSLTTVDEWLAKRYGSVLGAGAISWMMTARRVMLVPIGLLGAAAGQATGVWLAKLHAEGKRQELAQTLGTALAATASLSLMAAAAVAATARPVVDFLFQYGKFTPHAAEQTSLALQPLALAIPAWGVQQVAARAFYAVGDTWRPMAVTTALTLAMLPAYAAAAAWQDHQILGLCLAGATGISLQAGGLCWLAKRRLDLPVQPLLAVLAKALVAAGAVFAVGAAADAWAGAQVQAWAAPISPIALARACRLGVDWAAMAAAGVAAATMLGLPGLPDLAAKLARRLGISAAK